MSLVRVYDNEITNNSYNMGKAVPQDSFDMERAVYVARHMDGCSDLMQRDNYTEDLLVRGGKRKRGRRSNKPFFPLKEEVTVHPTKIPNYIGFRCRHFEMIALLRHSIEPGFIRMFV